MKEITKDIICECALFLSKVVLACSIISGVAYVGYNIWYVNHYTPEERMMIEEVRRKEALFVPEAEIEHFRYQVTNYCAEVVKYTEWVECNGIKCEYKENAKSKIVPNVTYRKAPVFNDKFRNLYKLYTRSINLSQKRFRHMEISGDVLEMGIVAKTIYLEASGEGKDGMKAVASVIFNRMNEQRKSGKDICLKSGQFSCWNNRRKNFSKIEIEIDDEYVYCMKLALDILTGNFNPTISANHYYNPKKCRPSWGRSLRQVKVIGNHRFGRIG